MAGRYSLEGGQEDDGSERKNLPDGREKDRRQGQRRIVTPVLIACRKAQGAQGMIEDAVLGIEHPCKDQCHRDRGGGSRDRDGGPRDPPAPEWLVQQKCGTQPQSDISSTPPCADEIDGTSASNSLAA
jgi:hypothetical protein